MVFAAGFRPEPGIAQTAAVAPSQMQQTLKDAASKGTPVTADVNVPGEVTAQAVLLPFAITKRIFGKEIARNYAAIEVNIANKSRDASFILQGLFLDYSNWALSGSIRPPGSLKTKDSQSATEPNQVASVEYRMARSELLDAQIWTRRNWTIRMLTLAGTIATGLTFSFKEAGIIKGIGVFGSTVVPGVAVAWPDNTVAQLNNISDFGYQTNKVLTKEGADIMVAFFPIERFLTPGMRKVFFESPALFFNPFAMLFDDSALRAFRAIAPEVISNDEVPKLRLALPRYLERMRAIADPAHIDTSNFSDEERKLLFLNQTSLNTIHVVVDGIMSVDAQSVPAKIDSITISNSNKSDTWAKAGDVKGTIKGSFLSGGSAVIAEADALGISNVTVDTKTSTNQQLAFAMTLKKGIDSGKTLTFRVSKTDKQGHVAESAPFPVKIDYEGGGAVPVVDAPSAPVHAGEVMVLKGKGYVDAVTVTIGKDLVDKTDVIIKSATELSVKVPKLEPGEYDLIVKTSAGESKAVKLTIAAAAPPKHDINVAEDPNQPLVLRVKYASAKPGTRNAGFLVIGDKLDKIVDVHGPANNPLVLHGVQPSPDGLYLDVSVSIPFITKPGIYKLNLVDATGKTVKEIEYKVE